MHFITVSTIVLLDLLIEYKWVFVHFGVSVSTYAYIHVRLSRMLSVFFPIINSKWHECHFHQTDYSLALAYTWVNHII